MEFLGEEKVLEVSVWLAQALLAHFCMEGIENACQFVMDEDEDLTPEQNDLRCSLVAVATAMGVDFPDYEEWHKEALATNYGWGDHKTVRISRNF